MTPAEILATVNEAWLHGAPGQVAPIVRQYFADDAVMIGPDLTRVGRGAEAIAASYDDFIASATILDVSLGEPQIDAFERVAIATLPWSMTYAYQGTQSSERGFDVYVFQRERDTWKICWRQMVTQPIYKP
jgi:ketosteroid isomerase-like protein